MNTEQTPDSNRSQPARNQIHNKSGTLRRISTSS